MSELLGMMRQSLVVFTSKIDPGLSYYQLLRLDILKIRNFPDKELTFFQFCQLPIARDSKLSWSNIESENVNILIIWNIAKLSPSPSQPIPSWELGAEIALFSQVGNHHTAYGIHHTPYTHPE